jgi:hypothetical protein
MERFLCGLCWGYIMETTCVSLSVEWVNLEEGEHPLLEAATKQWLVKTEKTLRVL